MKSTSAFGFDAGAGTVAIFDRDAQGRHKARSAGSVPGTAVQREGGRKYVSLLDREGKAVRREVKTGWKEGTYLEITSGLKEGDEVLEKPVKKIE